MRAGLVVTTLLLCGCGRLGFNTMDGGADAQSNQLTADDGALTGGPPADGPPADGPPIMGSCADYTAIAGGEPGSTYRVIATSATFWTHHNDCNNDNPGSTHLVTLQTAAEGDAVIAVAGGVSFYAGAVQAAGQLDPTDGWRWITGEPMTFGWEANEGRDGTDDVENGEEQVFMVSPFRRAVDSAGTVLGPAVCECDGRAISATIVIPPEP